MYVLQFKYMYNGNLIYMYILLKQIWDIIVGKILIDLIYYNGLVNIVEYYLNEFLLVFGSLDRQVVSKYLYIKYVVKRYKY